MQYVIFFIENIISKHEFGGYLLQLLLWLYTTNKFVRIESNVCSSQKGLDNSHSMMQTQLFNHCRLDAGDLRVTDTKNDNTS